VNVERVDFVSFLTQDCRQAWFKDSDGNALMLHPRYDV
jgi:hypothetical protein